MFEVPEYIALLVLPTRPETRHRVSWFLLLCDVLAQVFFLDFVQVEKQVGLHGWRV